MSGKFTNIVVVIFGAIILNEGEMLTFSRSFMRCVKDRPIEKPPVNFAFTLSKYIFFPIIKGISDDS